MGFLKNKNSIAAVAAAVLVIVSFLTAVKFLSNTVEEHYESVKTVCLDAGHGADDAGAISADGVRIEKNDNLRLTLKVRDLLEERGVKVVLTREDDSDITLKERCKLANKKRCDLFVSLHRNSAVSGSGFEAWIAKEPKGNEEELAKKLVKALCDISELPDRGVKRGYRNSSGNNYYVNSNTNMPSILLEVGFVTNEADNKSFDENLGKNAEAIADIIYESLLKTEQA
ncbi:MAG: N-acetylmuramoyl-L-alanine amidase [Clostridiaceae bacterium]|nr:N-acetylmuramoyl-L-alanine amidase [Clostridiaceae bacterium]